MMKHFLKKVSFALLFLACALSVQSQMYQREYLGDTYNLAVDDISTEGVVCMQKTSDGGHVYLTNSRISSATPRVSLFKADASGNVVWTREFCGAAHSWGRWLDVTPDGGFILTGNTHDAAVGSDDILMIRTDANGNELWSKTFGGSGREGGMEVHALGNSGFILVGYSRSTNPTGCGISSSPCADVVVIHTDASGNVINMKTYGGPVHDGDITGLSIQPSKAGGYIVAGGAEPFSSYPEAFVLRLDNNLNVIWSKLYDAGTGNYSGFTSVRPSSNPNFSGWILGGFINDNSNDRDGYNVLIDDNGNVQWGHRYSVSWGDWDMFNETIQAADGGYISIGFNQTSNLRYNVFAVKSGPTGTEVWRKSYGDNSSYETGFNVINEPGGGYSFGAERTLIGGSAPNKGRVYAIRTNAVGTSGCNETIPPGPDYATNTVAIPVTVNTGGFFNPVAHTYQLPDPIIQKNILCESDCQATVNVSISGSTILCGSSATATLTATASGGQMPYDYYWSNGQTGSSVTISSPGTYTVTVEDANGCVGTATVTVTQTILPFVMITPSPAGPYCEGDMLTLNSSYTGPGTYLWTDGGGGTISTGTAAGFFSLPAGTETYTLTITLPNGCVISANHTITVQPAPNISSLNSTYCADDNADLIFGTGSFGGNGTFTSSAPGAITTSSIGPFTFWYFNPSIAGPGTHTVTYCNNSTGCCTTQSVLVEAVPVFNDLGTVCATDPCIDLTAYAGPSGGGFSGPGVVGTDFCPSLVGPGTYTLQYCILGTGACQGCDNATVTVVSGANWPKFAAQPVVNLKDEEGHAIDIDGNGGYYVTGWYDGTIEFGGAYNFTALNNFGAGKDLFIVKYDECDDVVWATTASNTYSLVNPQEIIPYDLKYYNGNLYIAGTGLNASGLYKSFVFSVDAATGNINPAFGNVNISPGLGVESWGRRLAIDPATDELVVTGAYRGTITFPLLNQVPFGTMTSILNSQDFMTVKYDLNANPVWMQVYGGKEDDMALGATIGPDHGVFITGFIKTQGLPFAGQNIANPDCAQSRDIFIGAYDQNGIELWALQNGGPSADYGMDITIDGDNELLVTGRFRSVGGVPVNYGLAFNIPVVGSATNSGDVFLARYKRSNGTALDVDWAGSTSGFPQSTVNPWSIYYHEAGGVRYAYVSGTLIGNHTFASLPLNTNNSLDADPFVMRWIDNGTGFGFTQNWAALGGTPLTYNDKAEGTDVVVDANSSAYLTGRFYKQLELVPQGIFNGVNSMDYFAARLDPAGSFYRLDTPTAETPGENGIASPVVTPTEAMLEVWPNPSDGKFNLIFHDAEHHDIQIRIFDEFGRLVWERKAQSNTQFRIDLDQVAAGIYHLRLESGAQVYDRRIMID